MDYEKYQVFISSPFRKLKKHRKAAVEAVVNWGHIPIALENFSAQAAKDYEVITKAIVDCQIYILILGHTCGSLMPDSEKSYTEFEFEIALDKGMDILAFIEDLDEAKRLIDQDKDIEDKGISKKILENFHARIGDEERIFYRPWNKSTNLEEIFSRGIGELVIKPGEVHLPGWIRAREGERERTVQMALDNVFARDMVRNINAFEKLNERCGIDVREKETLSTCFRDRFLDNIVDNNLDLFFESGDCPAFVARELGNVPRFAKAVIDAKHGPGVNLFTNNILAFLQLLMNDRIPVTMLPKSSPQDVYGASYGILDDLVDDERVPDYSGSEIPVHALEAFKALANSSDGLAMERKPLLICSISGVQLSDDYKIEAPHEIEPALKKQISECHGFHVGSFKNLVFKRYLYNTGAPILMTATRAMLNMPIDPSRCHFLFNKVYSWSDFCTDYPLAFLVGCKDSQISETQDILAQLVDYKQSIFQKSGYASIIAANQHFIDATNIHIS